MGNTSIFSCRVGVVGLNQGYILRQIIAVMVLFNLVTFASCILILNEDELNITKTEGSDVTITCRVSHLGAAETEIEGSITWYRGPNDENLLVAAGRAPVGARPISITYYTAQKGSKHYIMSNLTIQGVSVADAGNYTCCKTCLDWVHRSRHQLFLNVQPVPSTTLTPMITVSDSVSDAVSDAVTARPRCVPHQTCFNGICQADTCACAKGYTGIYCNETDNSLAFLQGGTTICENASLGNTVPALMIDGEEDEANQSKLASNQRSKALKTALPICAISLVVIAVVAVLVAYHHLKGRRRPPGANEVGAI